ncbi:MAG: heat-inducible transcriptional repressor HrcA [Pseudomonadota bacterium]
MPDDSGQRAAAERSRADDGAASAPACEQLNERAQLFLKRVVERYIEDGVPVASKALASEPDIEVSAATVRNVMSELESRGLVRSPHTSAGKVPTELGLRLFVDTLLSVQPLSLEEAGRVQQELNPDRSPRELADTASRLLSHLTQMTCVVLLPRQNSAVLRHIEFLPLAGQRALVILVLNDRDVQNRVISLDRDYSEAELRAAGNLLNSEFGGRSLTQVREALFASMKADKDRMDQLMQAALNLASRALPASEDKAEGDTEYLVSGEAALLEVDSTTDRVRRLFETFTEKNAVLHLLDQCLHSDGIQLFIGQEAGGELFEKVSFVGSAYEASDSVTGVLGVVGPTRMAYQRVIPAVDLTARVLSAALRPTDL